YQLIYLHINVLSLHVLGQRLIKWALIFSSCTKPRDNPYPWWCIYLRDVFVFGFGLGSGGVSRDGYIQRGLMRFSVPSLGALQAFEATARLGSFSRAAEELSLSHSAVYRQVTNLEESLGVALFVRVRRRLALTEAGREYAARIRRHLEQLEK